MSLPGDVGRDGSASPPEAPRTDQRLHRSRRLRSRRQFLAVYASGRRVSCGDFTVFALPNDLEHSRLGVTASRKVGNAVKRNRAKRIVRELFRRNQVLLVDHWDVVVNVHRSMLEQRFDLLERDFVRCSDRLGREAKK